ncbi:hypothetical protein [Verrucosispora sp. NA02020]|uniref:hypothetical protein n=1 Tax=Verrucosispora sp. NA02020 TaxID=2742132 RepID=UPI0020CA53F2|nr:hypothetical protein [Verrucosispora sp. NA02020]
MSRQLQRVRGKLLHRDTKTQASDATLPLPDICLAALKLRNEQRDEARAAAVKAWHDNDLVFTTRYGTPIEPRNFQRSWQTRCDKAATKPITVHNARHTRANQRAAPTQINSRPPRGPTHRTHRTAGYPGARPPEQK